VFSLPTIEVDWVKSQVKCVCPGEEDSFSDERPLQHANRYREGVEHREARVDVAVEVDVLVVHRAEFPKLHVDLVGMRMLVRPQWACLEVPGELEVVHGG